MKALISRVESLIVVKKSKFISIALPCQTLEDVKPLLKQIRNEHPEATHVVHAAVVGKKGTLWASSDDREPKNTAGRPSLEVLKGSGITNILVCTIRYYGGTLLGTGGLVKAYGDSVKEVLKLVETEELIDKIEFSILISYDFYTRVQTLLKDLKAVNLNEEFTSGINIKGQIPLSEKDVLASEFADITQGRGILKLLDIIN